MPYMVCYWDSATGTQAEREATAEETQEIDALKAAAIAPVVPQVVTKKQARLALQHAGLLSQVQPLINALAEPAKTLTQIEWDDSDTYERNNPYLISLGTALGLTSYQIDTLFITASSL